MIDKGIKQCIGQMITGVKVVGAAHGGDRRLFTSHWVTQVSFEEPIVMASVSPKHDTHALIVASGEFSVSLLAADQISEAQYFSYPAHRMRFAADEYVTDWPDDPAGPPVVPNSISWLRCETFQIVPMQDHQLFFGRVVAVAPLRLKESPLLYSSRLGWRATGDSARAPGISVRDQLLSRVPPQADDA